MSNLFNFVDETGVRSDETTEYSIDLKHATTVQGVIDEIFDRQKSVREWGSLYLNNDRLHFGINLGHFGTSLYEPQLKDEAAKLPEWLFNAEVIKMKACGGWSRMDYYVWIYPEGYAGPIVDKIEDFKAPYDKYIEDQKFRSGGLYGPVETKTI